MTKVYKRICIRTQTRFKDDGGGAFHLERGKEYATGPVMPDKTVTVYCCNSPFPVVPVKHFAGAVSL